MITERILLAMEQGREQMSPALRTEYVKIADAPRLWPFAVLLALWHRGIREFNGLRLERELTYVDALNGRFPSLREFVQRAADAADREALGRAAAIFAYMVQVMGSGTLQGVLSLAMMGQLRNAALPPLDAVIISHDHYDHLDLPTVRELLRHDVPVFTSLGVGAHLSAWGLPPERIIELDWWESARPRRGDLTLTAVPSQHFSGRGVGGRNLTLWSSFVVKTPRHTAFFSGDTGLTPEYAEIREREGPFDLVMLEVGAFHPAWGDIHLGPENALAAHELLGGGSFLPVHWGTFNLALHAWDQPAEALLELAPRRGVHLVMPRLGEPVEPSRAEVVQPWWRSVTEAVPAQLAPAGAGEGAAADSQLLEEPID